jgi:hypothetical protein
MNLPPPPEGAVVLGRGKTFYTSGPFDGWALGANDSWVDDQYLGTDPNVIYAALANSGVALLNPQLIQAAPEKTKIKSMPVCQHGKSITEWCDVCDPKEEPEQKPEEHQPSNLAEFFESTQEPEKVDERAPSPCCEKHPLRQTPIPASKLLRAESSRLDILKHAMPDEVANFIDSQIWAYELAAAFLESLGAPEKIQGYFPANKTEDQNG